ncbi:hypothetical protein R5R35_007427 [Gryllus longicercus]|uniref:RDD domain-containing protein n=1 Tax=Gryllus longicercus TaxID=2509291 RepID=A0AAN9VEP3_9ORTH|nr:Uncharacterized protein GBIM_17968 [Gryllus bimaculatus]
MEEEMDTGTKLNQDPGSASSQYKTSAEYFDALEKWMQTVYVWHCFAVSFPYLLMTNQCFPAPPGQSAPNNVAGNRNTFQFPQPANQFGFTAPGGEALRNRQAHGQAPQQPVNNGVEYQIPPIWKRFVAEFLDFLILFFVKLAVTFIAVDVFNIIDLDKYDLDLLSRTGSINYKKAVEMTAEIVVLEGIHRVVVSIFEAFWIRRGQGGQVGGATPGKLIMGIRVVLCERVTAVEGRPPDTVLVYPATDLGWTWAFARSFVKNLVLAVLIPALFALFFLRHNRTGYDILCHTIVVEDRPRQH